MPREFKSCLSRMRVNSTVNSMPPRELLSVVLFVALFAIVAFMLLPSSQCIERMGTIARYNVVPCKFPETCEIVSTYVNFTLDNEDGSESSSFGPYPMDYTGTFIVYLPRDIDRIREYHPVGSQSVFSITSWCKTCLHSPVKTRWRYEEVTVSTSRCFSLFRWTA
jgi:hypothetical protein